VFSRFFIDRPIFAAVLSIVITLAGGLALLALPIAQYPQISPPNVSVECAYPGASAQVVAETVAAPIEQQVNGVENMMYMSSQCTNDGSYTLTITFKLGVDLNLAQVMVQNRVALALPLMPDVIKQTGVTTKKKAPDILMAVGVYSPPESRTRLDQLALSNYAMIHIQPELARLPGVSDVTMLGQRDYSMRIWVDPDRMAIRNVTAGDVARAIREQNLQVATGQVGQQSVNSGQRTQVVTKTLGRLIETEQFENIIVKTTPEGPYLRIKDIGRVELGAKNADIDSEVDGNPSGNLAVFQLPDANALECADLVMAKMEELKKDFPEGLDYVVRYNTTPFIRESIEEVFKTLRDAVILVALVVLLFLQNWRSAVIPLIAVPVAIIGTFAVMAVMGFSLNNLTLFGLVLAIGIVVDDAIVVVEAVEHHIEQGMQPRAATIKAMDEVSAPVIAVGLVLSAVFVPCAFITGITGQFFLQFALTIASSTIISTFNSLTLSPALAAILLRPKQKGAYRAMPALAFAALGGYLGYRRYGTELVLWAAAHAPESLRQLIDDIAGRLPPATPELLALAPWLELAAGVLLGWAASKPLNWLLSGFFTLFNRGFDLAGRGYIRIVGGMLRVSALVLLVYGGMLGLTYFGYQGFPKGILSTEFIEKLQKEKAIEGIAPPEDERISSKISRWATDARRNVVLFPGLPKGFIPSQDMGYLMINVQLPDSASSERTLRVMRKMQDITRSTKGVGHTMLVSGQSMLLSAFGSNFGSMFVMLDEFAKRPQPASERFFSWLGDPGPQLQLRSLETDVSKLPTKGKYQIIVAAVDNTLHFRMFDGDGKMVVDTDEKRLTEKATQIEKLRELLAQLWPPHELIESEKGQVISAVTSIVGHTLGLEAALRKTFHIKKVEPLNSDAIAEELRRRFEAEVPDALITVLPPPPVRGVGRAGGFKIMIEDRSSAAGSLKGLQTLQTVTDGLNDYEFYDTDPVTELKKQRPEFSQMSSVFRANVPQVFVDLNRNAAMMKDVEIHDIFETLQVYLGSLYVNDFNLFGRTWQVIVQSDMRFRDQIEDIQQLKIRNIEGQMVPLGSLARIEMTPGPFVLTRYNMRMASFINGAASPGTSSRQAIDLVDQLAQEYLPPTTATEWTEMAYIELLAGNTAMIIFGFAVVMVFLVLAAQYESWSLPFAVILVVPMCLLSAIAGVWITKMDINIFTQIGFVVLVGLASKNAILIVEFAKVHRQRGLPIRQATLEACRLRLRPIIMTSVAFILGVVPLLLSSGAGAEMRRTLGTAVFSGMLGVTAFGIFLTPVFFSVVDRLSETHLFATGPLRRFSDLVLGILSLSALRKPRAEVGAAEPSREPGELVKHQ
jgi:multidrug efflux pump subunit AcrB